MNHLYLPRGFAHALKLSCVASLLVAILTPTLVFTRPAFSAGSGDSAVASPKRTRFVIGVPKNCDFQVMSLSKPNRVVVDLPNVNIRLPAQPSSGPVGLVSSFTAGKAGPKRSLVVIKLTQPAVVQNAAIEKAENGTGYYLVLEIDPIEKPKKRSASAVFGKPAGLGAAGLQPPLPRPAQTPTQRAARTAKQTIVIDPGHGGEDTGAKKNGVVEKDVVLAFALILRDMLEKTGRYNVLMTRSDDTFISLGGRVDFGEKHRADLFIAVHADYARSKARGATVYSLRGSTARSLERSAKRRARRSVDISSDNFAASPEQGDDGDIVRDILTDLTRNVLNVTREQTDEVSRSLVSFMGDSTTLRQSPHKTAGFRVLKTAQFPSVLIELAYVTNKKDARNLTSTAWRKKVAKSIVTAVGDYFNSEIANLPM